ncbi:MAG: hypothetical protein WDW38_004773 [Sanguina aurantia]
MSKPDISLFPIAPQRAWRAYQERKALKEAALAAEREVAEQAAAKIAKAAAHAALLLARKAEAEATLAAALQKPNPKLPSVGPPLQPRWNSTLLQPPARRKGKGRPGAKARASPGRGRQRRQRNRRLHPLLAAC